MRRSSLTHAARAAFQHAAPAPFTHAAPTHAAPAAFTLAAIAALTLAFACCIRPAHAQPAQEPPLDISADNVTGSHSAEGDVVLLHGNLRVTRGKSVLTADNGRYLRAAGMLYVDGNVRMRDSTMTLTCDHASYSENDDLLQLDGNVVVQDREATLRAPAGNYRRRTGIAELYGGVDGREGTRLLSGERATYVRDSMLVRVRGPRVRGYDEENRLELLARAIDYDRGTHEMVATGEPRLIARDERGKATTLGARTLRLNTESRVAQALDSVRVVRDSLVATADSALFDDRAERGWLLGSPRVSDGTTAVRGDTLELWSEKRRLKRVIVRGGAEMDYSDARVIAGESNRLTGRMIDAWFTDDELDSLVAVGRARNAYVGEAKPGKTPERNSANGDSITVFFDDRKIDRARVEGRASGEYRMAVDVGDTLAAKREIVSYDATRLHFEVPKSRIVLDQNAHLVYRDLELRAKRVEFDVDRQTLVASGDPDLTDRGDRVTGHLMTYDMETRIGTIYQAETEYERGLYHGERLRKVNEKELDVMQGSYSTCDLDEPHYHFAARWMKIYLKDKLVAKPVVFYIKNVPLLALPFWIFPIKPGRHSGFLFPQFEFGFNSESGQFIRNAGYYWAPNDYMDMTVSGDYYQAEPSWVLEAEGTYKLLYVLDGNFRSSFARNERIGRDDWDLTADHSQEITPRTRIAARASFISSRDYSTSNQFGRSLSQRLNRFLTSSLALSHNAEWASISAAVERRQDLDADDAIAGPRPSGTITLPKTAPLANLTETLPSVSVSFPTRTIGNFGPLKGTFLEKPLSTLYFSLGSRFASLRERRAVLVGYRGDNTAILEQRNITRRAFATSTSLSDSRRLFGWLNVQPNVSAEGVVFDFDEAGHHFGVGKGRTLTRTATGVWRAGVSSGTTLYGTFRPEWGPLTGLRHIVAPSASFSYSPEFRQQTFVDEFGRTRQRFSNFGGFGVSGAKQASMSFGLDQRLQAKLKRGDKPVVLDNLLSLGVRGFYNFLWREQGAKHALSNLSWSMFVQPPGFVNASANWSVDVYSQRPLRNLGYNVGLNLTSGRFSGSTPALPVDQGAPAESGAATDHWSLGIAYSYAGGYAGPRWSSSQTANAVVQYQLGPGWGIDYSTSLDLSHRKALTQRFGLSRDLHCWVATFSRSFTTGGEAEYYFRLGVKEQREIYIERGTRTGSIGGIQ